MKPFTEVRNLVSWGVGPQAGSPGPSPPRRPHRARSKASQTHVPAEAAAASGEDAWHSGLAGRECLTLCG